MDAKNLAVLMQLKRAMEQVSATTEAAPAAHVPGQGFSEESEAFFRDLARRKLGIDPSPPENVIADPVMAELLRELRLALRTPSPRKPVRMKRVAAPYREPELTPEQLQKRAAKAARKAERLAKRKAERATAARRAMSIDKVQRKLLPDIKCPDCGSVIPRVEGQVTLPGLCRRCREKFADAENGFRSKSRTEYVEISLVPGGAPGSGKRK